jgi:hypothetical protein
MPDIRVGRDVGERLVSRITASVKLAPTEHITVVVRVHGKKPQADCLVITNARLMSVASSAEPFRCVRQQVLADEIETWALSRRFRSRLNVTSGYHRKLVYGSNISTLDDDLVDEGLTNLVAKAGELENSSAIRALRAHSHWIEGAHGRSVYVLNRSSISHRTAEAFDLDMVENQLTQFEHWPGSEARRHMEVCLPAGGCFLGAQPVGEPLSHAHMQQAQEIAAAVATIDSGKLRRASAREADVLQKLMSVIAHIRASAVWQTSYLDDSGLRIDLNSEVRQIALGCHQAAELREEMGDPPQRDSATGGRAAAVYNASIESLDAVVDRLDTRVDALAAYRDRLRVLSRELGDRDAATRIDTAADKVAALVAATIDEDDTESLPNLIPQAREGDDDAVPKVMSALQEDVANLRDAAMP